MMYLKWTYRFLSFCFKITVYVFISGMTVFFAMYLTDLLEDCEKFHYFGSFMIKKFCCEILSNSHYFLFPLAVACITLIIKEVVWFGCYNLKWMWLYYLIGDKEDKGDLMSGWPSSEWLENLALKPTFVFHWEVRDWLKDTGVFFMGNLVLKIVLIWISQLSYSILTEGPLYLVFGPFISLWVMPICIGLYCTFFVYWLFLYIQSSLQFFAFFYSWMCDVYSLEKEKENNKNSKKSKKK